MRELESARMELASKIARWTAQDPVRATGLPWFLVYRATEPSAPRPCVYEPSVAFIVQGRKQVVISDDVLTYDQSHFLLTSVDLPVTSHISEASEAQPYLGMRVTIDLAAVRQLIMDHELPAPKVAPIGRGMATGMVTVELLDALSRLMDLLDRPRELPVVAGLVHQEIAFRMLLSEQGGRLWQFAMVGSQSNRIQKVLNWLRHHYEEPLRIDELAEMAAMSVSSFHSHFREVTTMSPLQFQKQLRLQESRRLMLIDHLDAATAALRVGYESPSQFSREYSRMFGQPPMRDIKLLRV